MPANLPSILREASAVTGDEFAATLDCTINLLREEKGKLGNFNIAGRLVQLDPVGETVVVGDLHGDLKSLVTILGASSFMHSTAKRKDITLVFLGDYGDRGAYSVEVYYVILKLKIAFPEQVVLLRGNHEGPVDIMASPHDLPMQFQRRFKEKAAMAYLKAQELWNYLYNAVLVEERYIMVHGGLSPKLNGIDDLATAHETHPQQKFLEDMLWSDPVDKGHDTYPSPRGAGKLFAKNVTEKVLAKLNVNVLIRGHEPCETGFKISHEGKVLTLFSRRGAPYFNTHGAYLYLPLPEKFENAMQLVPWIHEF